MLYRTPQWMSDVMLSCEGAEYVLVRPDSAKRLRLTPPLVAVLMLIDGQRTVQVLASAAEKLLGRALPDGLLESLLEALEGAGLMVWARVGELVHATLPGTAHHCEGCGRSCEGHLIGPLPEDEAKTIRALWPSLVERLPRLAEEAPLVVLSRGGRRGVYLESVEGRCVFLGEDRLCEIHRHFGAASKPSICRMFPLVRVRTEEGLRLGVKPGCFRAHAQGVSMAGEASLGVLGAGWESLPEPLLDRAVEGEEFARREAVMLAVVGREDVSLQGFARFLLGGEVGAQAVGECVGEAALEVAWSVLKRVAEGLRLEDSLLEEMMAHEEGLGASFRSLITALDEVGDVPEGLRFTAQEWGFAVSNLRGLFFVREAMLQHPMVSAGIWMVGWLLGLSLARVDTEDARLDVVAETTVAWWRLVASDDSPGRVFVGRSEVEAFWEGLAQESVSV